MKKRMIFSNSYDEVMSIMEDIEENKDEIFNRSDVTKEDIENQAWDEVNFLLDDARYDLEKKLDTNIIAIGDIGTWRGRFSGYKIMGKNLSDILYSDCDTYELYAEAKNIRATGHHHDGTNYIEYRKVRNGVNIENLTEALFNGEPISRSKINYYTESLLPYVKDAIEWL